MSFYVLAFLIGVVAGLRAMMAPAAVSWAARLGWLNLSGTPLAFMGAAVTPYIFTLLALGELVNDKLPEDRQPQVAPAVHRPDPERGALRGRDRRGGRGRPRRGPRPRHPRRGGGDARRLRAPVAPDAGDRGQGLPDCAARGRDRDRPGVLGRQPALTPARHVSAAAARRASSASARTRSGGCASRAGSPCRAPSRTSRRGSSGSTSSPPMPRIAAPRISLRVGVDDDLHEALGLALLDGAPDARHRPLADAAAGGRSCAPAPRSGRRGRAAGRCRGRRR